MYSMVQWRHFCSIFHNISDQPTKLIHRVTTKIDQEEFLAGLSRDSQLRMHRFIFVQSISFIGTQKVIPMIIFQYSFDPSRLLYID